MPATWAGGFSAWTPTEPTPAHQLRDNVDYVPCRRGVLFGHHYASIAGLSPMLGPAIAVIWGWLPGMLWVVFGTLLIGAVHDFGALVLSMRNRGLSIGKVAEDIIGPRAKSLFHVLIFFLVCLAMGVFVHVVAGLFTASFYPEAVFPTFSLIAIALVVGWAAFRKSVSNLEAHRRGLRSHALHHLAGPAVRTARSDGRSMGSADPDLRLLRLHSLPSGSCCSRGTI